MSGNYDEDLANIDRSRLLTYFGWGAHVTHLVTFRTAQTSTVVKNTLNSANDLRTSYNDAGELKFLYLQGGVSNHERIGTSLSKDIVIMSISCLKVS